MVVVIGPGEGVLAAGEVLDESGFKRTRALLLQARVRVRREGAADAECLLEARLLDAFRIRRAKTRGAENVVALTRDDTHCKAGDRSIAKALVVDVAHASDNRHALPEKDLLAIKSMVSSQTVRVVAAWDNEGEAGIER